MGQVTTFTAARAALRNRHLRQSLYDEGQALMGPVIVNLHGQAHTDRRRLENRLFSPATVEAFEHDRLPAIIHAELVGAQSVTYTDRVDLVALARRTMLRLSVDVAGVDLAPPGDDPDDSAFDELFSLMHRLARASVVVHATGDKQAIIDDGNEALAEFDQRFHQPSLERRRRLIADGEALPADILTTLLINDDQLDLSPGDLLREVAYFPWVGAHSTAAQFVHAMHHILDWLEAHPDDRRRLIADDPWRLRFVHESLRLHPASPVARRRATEATVVDGRLVQPNAHVEISIAQANRDPCVFGPRSDDFDPDRVIAADVARWGLTFGSGMHACLGRELAGGRMGSVSQPHRQGIVSMLISAVLDRGARRDADRPPQLDTTTTRHRWLSYPVELTSR